MPLSRYCEPMRIQPDGGEPKVLEQPPDDVVKELRALRTSLDDAIPPKRLDHNLLIATWNVRAFGGLTEKWQTAEGDSPKRNLADVRAIAEILSRFDVIAIQEARSDLKALRHTLKVLGPEWGLILTDTTRGRAGNDERLAFIFDLRRVRPSGLACELVIPDEQLEKDAIQEGALQRQFARTPYAVSFLCAGRTFTLVTLHVIYADKPADRIGELKAIADWLADWAAELDDYGQNLVTLGDFNVDRKDDPNYQAFTSRGLRPPAELDDLPRTTADLAGKASFYDQIAWFHEDGQAKLTLDYTGQAGHVEWTKYYLAAVDKTERTWRVSDHYPLWAEFSIRAP